MLAQCRSSTLALNASETRTAPEGTGVHGAGCAAPPAHEAPAPQDTQLPPVPPHASDIVAVDAYAGAQVHSARGPPVPPTHAYPAPHGVHAARAASHACPGAHELGGPQPPEPSGTEPATHDVQAPPAHAAQLVPQLAQLYAQPAPMCAPVSAAH